MTEKIERSLAAAVLACAYCQRRESSGYTMVHLCPFHAMGLAPHVLAVAHERRDEADR